MMNEFVLEEIDSQSEIDLIHAELVAKEKEALEIIKDDICRWLSKLVAELKDISPPTFMERLETGMALCKLVSLVQKSASAAAESGKKLNFSVPMAPLSCSEKAEPGSFFARDNAANFINWCRELGVEETMIFESEGLVLHKDEKRVILCLLDVARYAERVGISPPELVRMEREIEQLEAGKVEESPVSREPEEEKEKLAAKTIVQVSVTPVSVSSDKEVTPNRRSKTPEVTPSDKEQDISGPQRKIPHRTKLHLSSRKPIYTPSRIPVPIRLVTRAPQVQSVPLATTRQLRKRQRDERESEEDEGDSEAQHKAKKLKRSPVNATTSSSTTSFMEDGSSPVKRVNEEKRRKEVTERRHESVEDKVC